MADRIRTGAGTAGLAAGAHVLRRATPQLQAVVPPAAVVLRRRLARLLDRERAERRARRRRLLALAAFALTASAAAGAGICRSRGR